MDRSDLLTMLQRFGLGEEGAEVYVDLLHRGPRKASDIAESTGHHRTKVYRLLDELVAKDVVRASVGRPTIYAARSPEEVVGGAIQRRQAGLADLERLREPLLEQLRHLQGDDPPQEDGYGWRVIQGRESVYETVQSMIPRARRRLGLLVNHPVDLRRSASARQAMELLADRTQDGLGGQALLGNHRADLPEMLGGRRPPRLEVRRLDVVHPLQAVLADEREALVWLVLDPRGSTDAGDVAVWSDAPGLVASQALLFRRLWDLGAPSAP